ncbi:MAG TPA: ABC transporter ATP-binding protein, partial [Ferruginibacter sp.]|nr:ABC transporter ATP-binding protein [Ferruginibacter sp.]
MSNTPIIEIEQLTKTFRHATEPAVKGISFAINRNEIFGLLGPNGAGKTTTISILCGLFPPTSGKVMINGQDFQTHSTEIRQMIGIVPQDIALYPTLNARENLEFYGSMYGLYGRELRNSINDWLNKLGL